MFRWFNTTVLKSVKMNSLEIEGIQPGKTVIVFFTTPDCAPCKSMQHPALMRLQQLEGDKVQVIEINAYEKPEIAKNWGVMSVPTTFVLDSSGKPRIVNHGVASTEKLLDQIRKL